MDIGLFFAVMRRFKKIVLGGLVLGIVLAGLVYKTSSKTYESQAEALITQSSFPYGRAAASGSAAAAGSAQIGNPGVLAGLSPVYAQLANGDAIREQVLKQTGVNGTINASEVLDLGTGSALPFVQFISTASTPGGAVMLTQKEFELLSSYITQQQIAAGVTPADRAQLVLTQSGNPPMIAGGSSKNIVILVFVAMFGGAIAIAFFKERADPRTAVALGRVPASQPHLVDDGVAARRGDRAGHDYVSEPNGRPEGPGVTRQPVQLRRGTAARTADPSAPSTPTSAPSTPTSKSVLELLIQSPSRGSSVASKTDAS